MTTRQLDLTGLKCPLPALKTRKALSGIRPGERLEVRCTDPLAAIDIPNLINDTGDRLEAMERDGDHIIFLIVRAQAAPV
ncbi:MAG: sulfurtransferase TusA family protein [Mesorhizobium sp.]|uniref:sulfurtransferase TusA family protein n=1 Tax=unclassified Mesorhizobium TaxID=325217 RepID=UPI000FC9FF9B|nr:MULTISPECIES: sulfurtransferase TusA family protein [unclassified Mesorhizobium]RUV72709.1 sulfurtransferase TusA family protein [Mesorhizobium sp. M5C.F.Cr.IN.023.01.1.1]RWF90510.1 MAG: sulfurtransferase TusA family protein [Mesorhizobium sp.]RWF96790.1 MAG: sulfurtransferase TusA family protein [Mesorhizobium sp.]RWI41719.1 MAG: sulfurtransferase TusA family protein [Mesorhizobium sp.]RWI42269.1 MAG: sulfurtransferase TusA family protein [Mesorhizobium sp.]